MLSFLSCGRGWVRTCQVQDTLLHWSQTVQSPACRDGTIFLSSLDALPWTHAVSWKRAKNAFFPLKVFTCFGRCDPRLPLSGWSQGQCWDWASGSSKPCLWPTCPDASPPNTCFILSQPFRTCQELGVPLPTKVTVCSERSPVCIVCQFWNLLRLPGWPYFPNLYNDFLQIHICYQHNMTPGLSGNWHHESYCVRTMTYEGVRKGPRRPKSARKLIQIFLRTDDDSVYTCKVAWYEGIPETGKTLGSLAPSCDLVWACTWAMFQCFAMYEQINAFLVCVNTCGGWFAGWYQRGESSSEGVPRLALTLSES